MNQCITMSLQGHLVWQNPMSLLYPAFGTLFQARPTTVLICILAFYVSMASVVEGAGASQCIYQ